jgi:DNA-binding transcriptional LysR family regulator
LLILSGVKMLSFPSLRQLEVFITLARLGNFSAAAAALDMTQSAISQSLVQLETLLDVKLFDRTTRALALTSVGTFFLPRAERSVQEIRTALEDLDDISHARIGQLAVASLSSMAHRVLPVVLNDLRRKYARVRVTVVDDSAQGVLNHLANGLADIALSSRPENGAKLAFVPLFRDAYQLVCRRDHPWAGRKSIKWAMLKGQSFVALSREAGIRTQLDREVGRFLPPEELGARQLGTVLGLIEAGIGVSALPALACPAESHSALASVPLVAPRLDREIGLLSRAQRSLTPAAHAFVTELVQHLNDRKVNIVGVEPVAARFDVNRVLDTLQNSKAD